MSLDERRFGLQPVFPDVVSGMERIEEEGEKYEEWLSPDEKFRVVSTIVGGGKGWEGVWLREMHLISTDKAVGGDLMKVQWIKQKGVPEIITNVYVEVLKVNLTNWHFESYGYSSDCDGMRESIGATSFPTVVDKNLIMEDCIEGVVNSPVHFESDLPDRIDVEETARLFMEQLEDRNFILPVLVPE